MDKKGHNVSKQYKTNGMHTSHGIINIHDGDYDKHQTSFIFTNKISHLSQITVRIEQTSD